MRQRRASTSATVRGAVVERVLRPFSRVRPGEGPVALLMLACVFLILCSYYLMKTAREGMILSHRTFGLSGQELKAYASGAMALLLIGVVPAYSAFAARVRRTRLINASYVFVIGCLLVFYALAQLQIRIGLAYFIWLGLVNVFLVAQFWSYANDLYTKEQGERLFAIIGIGGSLGGVVGPRLASLAGTHTLLLFAGALLLPCIALFNLIERVHVHAPDAEEAAREPIGGEGGFGLVLHDRYLLLIAGLVFVGALVNTVGEYVLSDVATQHAIQLVPATAHAGLSGAARQAAITHDRSDVIKSFYGSFFFWVNLAGFLIQAFVVSRVIERFGVRRALFVMPLVALGAYGAIAMVGTVALVRSAKIVENSTDYSLENTVRQTLFLPTGRAVKYKAKEAIDTFGVRFGDTVSALIIWFGLHELGMHARGLAAVNLALVAVWLALGVGIAIRHRQLTRATEPAEAPEPALELEPVPVLSPLVPSGAMTEEGALT